MSELTPEEVYAVVSAFFVVDHECGSLEQWEYDLYQRIADKLGYGKPIEWSIGPEPGG